VVYPKVIAQRVMKELPFMATENIMMQAVKKGGDRQQLHERLRVHSIAAAARVKEEGLDNDLIDRVCADPDFGLDKAEVEKVLDPAAFTGLSAVQTEEFVARVAGPILEKYKELLGETAVLSV